MKSTFSDLFSGLRLSSRIARRRCTVSRHHHTAELSLESLEDRTLLSGLPTEQFTRSLYEHVLGREPDPAWL